MNEEESVFLSDRFKYIQPGMQMLEPKSFYRCRCGYCYGNESVFCGSCDKNTLQLCSFCHIENLDDGEKSRCRLCKLIFLPADEFSILEGPASISFFHRQEFFYEFFDGKDSYALFRELPLEFSNHLLHKGYARIAHLEKQMRHLEEQMKHMKDLVLSLELHPDGEEAEKAVKRARSVALKLENKNEQ